MAGHSDIRVTKRGYAMVGEIAYACGCTRAFDGMSDDPMPDPGEDVKCGAHGATTVKKWTRRTK